MDVDFEKNSGSLKISQDIYLRILRKAVEQTHRDLAQFEGALQADDFETLKSISHRLKGDYDNLRITDLSSLARAINDSAKSGGDKEKIAGWFEEFRKRFRELESLVPKQ